MKIVRRLAPLFPVAAALAALALVACAAPAEDEAGEAQGASRVASKKADGGAEGRADAASQAGPKELVEPGKYVNFEKGAHLFVTGRLQETNQLRTKDGETIAYGTLGADGRTLRAPEGDVCGSYTLSQVPGRLTVDVIWNAEGSVALDEEVAKGCSAFAGNYEME